MGFIAAVIGTGMTGAFLNNAGTYSSDKPDFGSIDHVSNYIIEDSDDSNNISETHNSSGSGNGGGSGIPRNIKPKPNSTFSNQSGQTNVSGSGGSTIISLKSNNNGHTQGDDAFDLKIRDNDEFYRHGVTATWVAKNVLPGHNYDFLVPFVQLIKTSESADADHLEIAADYSVIEEMPCAKSDTQCDTDLHPDGMAKEMLITRCVYKVGVICIDCLTGKEYDAYDAENGICAGRVLKTRSYWKVQDANADGKQSFYDLKNTSLDNLPLVPNLSTPQFEMGVKFSESAGNDFQGDTFNLTMIFTLNQDVSQ